MTIQETTNSINDLYRDWKKLKTAQASVRLQFHAAVKRVVKDHYCEGKKCFVKKNALCKKDASLATAVFDKWKRITRKRKPETLDRDSIDPVEIYAAKVETVAMCLVPAVRSFDPTIRRYEKGMVALVNALPIAAWADELPGFSTLGLAKIMAEAGNDIGRYRNPACLWKRFGLGLVREKEGGDLVRQRRRTGELGTVHGFCPPRRALMFVVQGTIHQNGKKVDNEYYAYSEEVKAKAILNHPDWTKGHVFQHQRRLLAKRLLRNLWVKWRACMPQSDAAAQVEPSTSMRSAA